MISDLQKKLCWQETTSTLDDFLWDKSANK